jgi:Leucine-rich repeat (LRR) protein
VLPDTIGLLKQLEELNLRDNALIRLPASVSQLCSLNILNLGTSALVVFPIVLLFFSLLFL